MRDGTKEHPFELEDLRDAGLLTSAYTVAFLSEGEVSVVFHPDALRGNPEWVAHWLEQVASKIRARAVN